MRDKQSLTLSKMRKHEDSIKLAEHKLLLSSTFSLNNSATKQVSVGIDWQEDTYLVPSVQMYGTDPRKNITMRFDTWEKMADQLDYILSYFDIDDNCPDFYRKFSIIECDDVNITFTMNHNHRAVIFDQNNCRLVMHAVTIRGLKKKSLWINRWLNILCRIPLYVYAKHIIAALADFLWTEAKTNKSLIDQQDEVEKIVLNNIDNLCTKFTPQIYHESGRCHTHQYLFLFFAEAININFDVIYREIVKHIEYKKDQYVVKEIDY